jgi:hypothetical protein
MTESTPYNSALQAAGRSRDAFHGNARFAYSRFIALERVGELRSEVVAYHAKAGLLSRPDVAGTILSGGTRVVHDEGLLHL